ncbi:SLATT domain-containing protein [Yersinia frederiksenii]|uniref:SLATT domain-containing protein n=1 Tax=Yersinia frederiksenii TaxID=29484 RepID=UPI00155D93CF|nr:SLATT domain-containing protein [Yersinia frederiksenii]
MSTEHKLKSLNRLESEIDARIKEFNAKRKYNQENSKFYSFGQVLLSGLTTILIAVNTKFSFFWITIVALVASCLANLAGQILSKYMYQERMAMNISTICDLYELRHLITMDKRMEEDDETREITLDRVQEYQNEYQNILNCANNKWREHIYKSKAKDA